MIFVIVAYFAPNWFEGFSNSKFYFLHWTIWYFYCYGAYLNMHLRKIYWKKYRCKIQYKGVCHIKIQYAILLLTTVCVINCNFLPFLQFSSYSISEWLSNLFFFLYSLKLHFFNFAVNWSIFFEKVGLKFSEFKF